MQVQPLAQIGRPGGSQPSGTPAVVGPVACPPGQAVRLRGETGVERDIGLERAESRGWSTTAPTLASRGPRPPRPAKTTNENDEQPLHRVPLDRVGGRCRAIDLFGRPRAGMCIIAPPFRTRSPRRRGGDRGRRARAASAASRTRRRVEDEEADLVLEHVDRAVEADACPLPCQLLCRQPCPPFAGGALSRSVTSEVGLDEVARHALDVTAATPRWKRQNV